MKLFIFKKQFPEYSTSRYFINNTEVSRIYYLDKLKEFKDKKDTIIICDDSPEYILFANSDTI